MTEKQQMNKTHHLHRHLHILLNIQYIDKTKKQPQNEIVDYLALASCSTNFVDSTRKPDKKKTNGDSIQFPIVLYKTIFTAYSRCSNIQICLCRFFWNSKIQHYENKSYELNIRDE